MRYKVINHLWKTEEGEPFDIISYFDCFEDVTNKFIKDLNSLWKGIVPFPFSIEIQETDDNTVGEVLIRGNEVLAKHDSITPEIIEAYGSELKKWWSI